MSQKVDQRLKVEDFNSYQTRKFAESSKNIRRILDQEIKNVTKHYERYKV
jgi:hypothetical protein